MIMYIPNPKARKDVNIPYLGRVFGLFTNHPSLWKTDAYNLETYINERCTQ